MFSHFDMKPACFKTCKRTDNESGQLVQMLLMITLNGVIAILWKQ